ncbi:MAG: DUF2851 family protein [Muribaculaceae bacterium]|nr:DUF2851 family protein [Muribaculaceae bacterium]
MELLYHYLWHHRMLGTVMTDLQGHRIEILAPGRHNDDAGPDFTNARLRIDGKVWSGNIEIHVKASDWMRHRHDSDPAYDNVILHVVAFDDTRIRRQNGEEIPQITAILPEKFFMTYAELARDLKEVRCAPYIPSIPNLIREDWLETLAVERIQAKASRLLDYNSLTGGDWEQAVFILFARGLGFGLNGIPFEILAKNLPLRIIYHHSDSQLQIEALIFGQAGMLNGSDHIFDTYYQSLCAEYGFLARKYGLRPINASLWKYARTRPQNFPHRRLALLARALYEGVRFSSSLEKADGDYDKLFRLFAWEPSDYWKSHADFGSEQGEGSLTSTLSRGSRNLMMINVAAPFYMAHARITGNYDRGELALGLLRGLPAEKNSLIKAWESMGIKADDASRSQALLHLKDQYCDKGRCLECRFGHHILRREVKPQICHRPQPDLNSMPLVREPAT